MLRSLLDKTMITFDEGRLTKDLCKAACFGDRDTVQDARRWLRDNKSVIRLPLGQVAMAVLKASSSVKPPVHSQ